MKKIYIIPLFVLCILFVLLIDAQDISSMAELLVLHPVDYIFLVFWAGLLFLFVYSVAGVSQKLYAVAEKKLVGRQKNI